MRHGGFLLGRSPTTLSLSRARLPGPGRRTGLSTGSPTAVAALERARRDHHFARETRSGGDNALFSISAAWGEAERTEREAAAAMTSNERIVDRSTRARDSVDAATPPPPGASTARTLAVGTTGGRSLLGRQRLVHDLLGSCRIFRPSCGQRSWTRPRLSGRQSGVRRCIRRSSCRYDRRDPKWATACGRVN